MKLSGLNYRKCKQGHNFNVLSELKASRQTSKYSQRQVTKLSGPNPNLRIPQYKLAIKKALYSKRIEST